MEFSWLNLFGLLIIVIMMIPNIIYAKKRPSKGPDLTSKGVLILEQVGRYASMALMVLPLGIWKFSFPSVFSLLIYLFANGILLLSYLLVWGFYFRKVSLFRAMVLAIIPAGIFLISGICLHHWLLIIAAILFALGHISTTYYNHRTSIQDR